MSPGFGFFLIRFAFVNSAKADGGYTHAGILTLAILATTSINAPAQGEPGYPTLLAKMLPLACDAVKFS